MRIPALALSAFEAVVRLGNLSAAAEELAITEGAVSRHLSNLSALLGAQLFDKAGRRLLPTAAACTLAHEVRAANSRIEDALTRFKTNDAGLPLRLAAPPTFTTSWLIPRLGKLREVAPELNISIVTHVDANANTLEDGVADVLIDVGRWPKKRDLTYSPFMEDASGPVLSPTLARKNGGVRSASDLVKFALLSPRSRPHMFEEWCRAASVKDAPNISHNNFDHMYHTQQAASAGLGFAIGSYCYIFDSLKRGELIAPLGLTTREIPFYLAWPQRLADDRRVRVLLAWLVGEANEQFRGRMQDDR